MSLRKTFKTDVKAETEGVWVEADMNEYNGKPVEIHISRMSKSNKRYSKRLEAVTRPHQSAIQNESFDNDLAENLLRNVFVDTILLGWRNLPKSDLTGNDADNDVELEFNRENALALFKELPECYDDWAERARKAAAFREATSETAAGN